MRPSDSESQKFSSRAQSITSSKMKINTSGRIRRAAPKNITSILQQRQDLRVIEDGVDMTPKPLVHFFYPSIEEKQVTAFDTFGFREAPSSSQLVISASAHGGLKASSSLVIKTSSVQTAVLVPEDIVFDSLTSTQIQESPLQSIDEDRAPSQFCLPRYNSDIFHVPPAKVTITLKETETVFIFEMPQLTEDLRTPEGQAVKSDNERYEYITVGAGSNRKLATAETQTPCVHMKTRSSYLGRHQRRNQGTFVNNWVLYDTFAEMEALGLTGNLVLFTDEAIKNLWKGEENRMKLPKLTTMDIMNPEDQLAIIGKTKEFKDAVRIVTRIISSNLYIVAQKRFKGLIGQDPCSLSLEFTYSLDLLWKHTYYITQGRPVSCFRWNYINQNVLAAGYGAAPSADSKTGLVLIWSIKNPSLPGRVYTFNSQVSDMDWSRDKPNLLAVGFYDGVVKVIDVSSLNLVVMRSSRRSASPSYAPHWQVQWWEGEEQFDFQEQIYTSNQDGRILCYRSGEDFTATEIMRISRVEGKIRGVKRTNHCAVYDIPISRNSGALLLKRHPTLSNIYFVGSDEGCVHRCSTNYLHQHIEGFLAHDGPIYSMEFSPFCSKIFLTCGADWCTRIWAEGIFEPLITLSTQMACVRAATWSPTISTVIACTVNNEICLWDIKRKTYVPTSITISTHAERFLLLEFTKNGSQLVAADIDGAIYVYSLEGMPFPPYNQTRVLVNSIERALITKPALLRKLKKLGEPF
ncbi:WD repeat-containing protein 78 [Cephus cinctus]|uniref:Dynein axonemal intermediate chain 4 n=1 Tax=Cephus cinctus TaxID=211228 RepID=A0AAJ7BXB0_CEPCN|nr:WD repeat-containing protein 78 [Cephus cinctus]